MVKGQRGIIAVIITGFGAIFRVSPKEENFMSHTRIPARSEIPLATTWSTESIFSDIPAWQAAFDQVSSALPGLARFQGTLSSSLEPAFMRDLLVVLSLI